MDQKAKLSTRKEKFNPNHRKQDKLLRAYKILDSKFNELIDCRIYFPATVAYCKQSACVGEAISNAGYDLKHNINGVGMGAIRGALLAIGKTITRRKLHIVECYS